MMTVCIQCALEDFVRMNGNPSATAAMFDESPEEHQRRVHPNLEVTQARRRVLEEEAAKIIAKMNRPGDGA